MHDHLPSKALSLPLLAPRSLVSFVTLAALVALAAGSAGCATSALSPSGSRVAATRNPPPTDCVSLKYIVGKGGGAFGGGAIANEDLIEYAMNDLRNKAAEVGANYVQHDPPQLGSREGTTTTATITGTAYKCSGPTNVTTSTTSAKIP
jgi:hypothetical protein